MVHHMIDFQLYGYGYFGECRNASNTKNAGGMFCWYHHQLPLCPLPPIMCPWSRHWLPMLINKATGWLMLEMGISSTHRFLVNHFPPSLHPFCWRCLELFVFSTISFENLTAVPVLDEASGIWRNLAVSGHGPMGDYNIQKLWALPKTFKT